jgi:phosphoribosylglycinamide formyltransferase 2
MILTATILLLGSGELGREFAISAKRLGACVRFNLRGLRVK